jgi:hypothetical protein
MTTEDAVNELWDSGLSAEAIAAQLAVSDTAVWRILSKVRGDMAEFRVRRKAMAHGSAMLLAAIHRSSASQQISDAKPSA